MCFITWRTYDSMPRDVMDRWLADRNEWLRGHAINPRSEHWRRSLAKLSIAEQHKFHDTFSARFEALLDDCHGECVLRRPELAKIVGDSLRHFDGERYVMTDFVVMPNHAHLLAAFPSADDMLKQCESWKHYTAVKINRQLGKRGRFWEVDGFDQLVRSEEQFEYYRQYIADNPQRARLHVGEFLHYSREL